MKLPRTPSQTVGPYYAIGLCRRVENELVPPGGPGALGLWRARDEAEMRAIVRALPLDAWMTTVITPLNAAPGRCVR